MHAASLERKKMCPCEARIIHMIIDTQIYSELQIYWCTQDLHWAKDLHFPSKAEAILSESFLGDAYLTFLRAYKKGELHIFLRKVQSFTIPVI